MEQINVETWIQAYDGSEPPKEVYCQTRDVVQARAEALKSTMTQDGWDETRTALVIAIVGELTSNAFDHNLGKWADVPGCWFEYNMTTNELMIVVADRGQGIRASLSRVRPGIDDAEALRIAFAEHVTGRAPEKRGNGLKFVINALSHLTGIQLTYCSGSSMLSYSDQEGTQPDILSLISRSPVGIRGVYAKLSIKKSL